MRRGRASARRSRRSAGRERVEADAGTAALLRDEGPPAHRRELRVVPRAEEAERRPATRLARGRPCRRRKRPVVALGTPGNSKLIEAVSYRNPDLQMPPDDPLAAGRGGSADGVGADGALAGRRRPAGGGSPSAAHHRREPRVWSFQPVKDQPVPQVDDAGWPRNAIDAFVLAKLEAEGLTPAAEADRVTLVRRAYFDLHGLPPTPAEVEAFVGDASADAWGSSSTACSRRRATANDGAATGSTSSATPRATATARTHTAPPRGLTATT